MTITGRVSASLHWTRVVLVLQSSLLRISTSIFLNISMIMLYDEVLNIMSAVVAIVFLVFILWLLANFWIQSRRFARDDINVVEFEKYKVIM
jgi:Na+/glutamate symporter